MRKPINATDALVMAPTPHLRVDVAATTVDMAYILTHLAYRYNKSIHTMYSHHIAHILQAYNPVETRELVMALITDPPTQRYITKEFTTMWNDDAWETFSEMVEYLTSDPTL